MATVAPHNCGKSPEGATKLRPHFGVEFLTLILVSACCKHFALKTGPAFGEIPQDSCTRHSQPATTPGTITKKIRVQIQTITQLQTIAAQL